MTNTDTYFIPSKTIRVEQDIKRSRFIATIGRAENAGTASSFIDDVRAEFTDASHNCWAYIAGPPDNTLAIGMSDDGEPHGTAGTPMLTVLKHSGIGEIVVVVTRYFGGTKLGAGGLVRAYSGSVQQALEQLPVSELVIYKTARILIPYPQENPIRHLLETMALTIRHVDYQDRVTLDVPVPSHEASILEERIRNLTQGTGTVNWLSEDQ